MCVGARACGILNGSRIKRLKKRCAASLSLALSLSLLLLLLFSVASTEDRLPFLSLPWAVHPTTTYYFTPSLQRQPTGAVNRPSSSSRDSPCIFLCYLHFLFILPGKQQFLPAVGNHDHGEGRQCSAENGSSARTGTDELLSHLSYINLCCHALVGQCTQSYLHAHFFWPIVMVCCWGGDLVAHALNRGLHSESIGSDSRCCAVSSSWLEDF